MPLSQMEHSVARAGMHENPTAICTTQITSASTNNQINQSITGYIRDFNC